MYPVCVPWKSLSEIISQFHFSFFLLFLSAARQPAAETARYIIIIRLDLRLFIKFTFTRDAKTDTAAWLDGAVDDDNGPTNGDDDDENDEIDVNEGIFLHRDVDKRREKLGKRRERAPDYVCHLMPILAVCGKFHDQL